ncbi:hypothetical protein OU5_P0186 (plasmid) [Pseudomonas mandelii JR-1]|jgi:hypothetical protein|uniref:Integral membrane protein n=1 Tax=Pseudomonas mandelii JR-1 TaxID=1147786 RepID=A0A024EM09_9PSED|nr:membrane protein [Pseudomonas mandelii]AHZ73438.1 hypothetical protein OU5_P0186 [Pseudomonas mandelii JR-1]MDZ4328605.1 hypothetical protein [Pseudomonas sp.]
MTTKIAMTGAALALAAAGLFSSIPTPVVAEEAQTIHCYGINACKGKNDCMTAKNACKGQGTCKGKGFLKMTKAECNNAGGKVGN